MCNGKRLHCQRVRWCCVDEHARTISAALMKMSMEKMPMQKVVFMQAAPTRVERDVAMDGYVRLAAYPKP